LRRDGKNVEKMSFYDIKYNRIYHYPPNKSEKAVQTVIRQAELKCKEMVG